MKPRNDITDLLHAWTGGDETAREEVMRAVYAEVTKQPASRAPAS